jgi:hypothetical protein
MMRAALHEQEGKSPIDTNDEMILASLPDALSLMPGE